MVNRYEGEIHINPIAILRNDDFNNDGAIVDVDKVLAQAIEINQTVSDRLTKLRSYLKSKGRSGFPRFNFAEGGYISMKGLSDKELLQLQSNGLIELFDWATDKDWVKKHGAEFGLVWEGGQAKSEK
jgi:hypothetical protein